MRSFATQGSVSGCPDSRWLQQPMLRTMTYSGKHDVQERCLKQVPVKSPETIQRLSSGTLD